MLASGFVDFEALKEESSQSTDEKAVAEDEDTEVKL